MKLKIISRLIAISIMLLVVSMPVLAADELENRYARQTPLNLFRTKADLGESIVINVANYEPTSIRQAMIEQQNVPIFVYLKGTTLGTLMSPLSDNPDERDPLIGITNIPPIKSVVITPFNISRDYIAGYRPVPPNKNQYSLANMGYIIINLKRIQNYSALPERESSGILGKLTSRGIDLQMQADISFDFEKGSFLGISNQERVLEPIADDNDWMNNRPDLSPYSILGGRAYLRATEISPDSATFIVYDKSRNPISLISEYEGSNEAGIEPMTRIRLTPTHTSNILSLGLSGDPFTDNFRIRLDRIITPQSTATLNIIANGQNFRKTLRIGDKISESSSWTLKEISDKPETLPKPTQKDIHDFKVDITELNTNVDDLAIDTNEVTLQNRQTGGTKTLLTRKLVSSSGILAPKSQLSDEAVAALEDKYCPPEAAEQETIKQEPACSAVSGFKKVISQHPSSAEVVESYFNLGEIYNKNLILFNQPCNMKINFYSLEACASYHRDMSSLASYYYNRVISLNPARAYELQEKLYDQSYSIDTPQYLDDDDVTVSLLSSKIISDKDKGSAKIKINDYQERQYFVGDFLKDGNGENIKAYNEDGRLYYFKVDSIGTNRIVIYEVYTAKSTIDSVKKTAKSAADKISTKVSTVLGLSHGLLLNDDNQIQYYDTPVPKEGEFRTLKLKVTKIDSKNEAYVTILPGLTEATISSNFSLHIPIEPRPFSYTPDELRDKINSTRDIIKKLDDVIDNLDSVVRAWKRTCIVTFGILTLKNSFLTGTSRNIARKDVSAFFKQKCAEDVANKKYTTKIECYSENSAEIERAIDANQNAIDSVQSQLSGRSVEELEKTDKDFKNFEMVDGTAAEYRDYLRYKALKEQFPADSAFGKYVQGKYKSIDYEGKTKIYNKAEEFASKYAAENPNSGIDRETIIAGFIATAKSKPSTGMNLPLGMGSITGAAQTTQIFIKETAPGSGNFTAVANDANGNPQALKLKRLTALSQRVYQSGSFKNVVDEERAKCPQSSQTATDSCALLNIDSLARAPAMDGNNEVYVPEQYLVDSEKIRANAKNTEIPAGKKYQLLSDPQGILYTPATGQLEDKFYSSSVSQYAEDKLRRNDYSLSGDNTIIAQYDNNGNAYCYPVGKGEYVQVLERYSTGDPKTIKVLNVGADGVIDCGRPDDVQINAESELKQNAGLKGEYVAKVKKAPRCTKEGDIVGSVDGRKIKCSKNSFLTDSMTETTECIDTMDPADCRLLFNACDPVMCPASRCNLGGRYTPTGGVISTGLVGSTVLCMPNFPEVVVPFCLTGILSGLKGIRSILQGYADCLEANLKDGSNVGFCDYINSLGICEILWRETMFILDMKGGVLTWLSEKAFGEEKGGAEYLTFQSALDNMGQSVDAFTKEYSDTRIAALYKGTSTREFGAEVCRRAIYAKFPSIGDILDQLSEPEDPPQFYAFFDTAPYVTQAGSVTGAAAPKSYGGKELTAYTVFYHIYAGSGFSPEQSAITAEQLSQAQNAGIRYSVLLRNKQTNKVLYVTTNPEEYGDETKTLPAGGYAQQTIHTTSEPGFDEICVIINGKRECGFGKVTSDFALKYTEDVLAEDEATRKEIKSAEDCTPEYSETSPTLGSIPTPVSFGLLSTGTSRVCALVAPNGDTNRWISVGSCGKDEKGLDLGQCWLDEESINIEDKERKEKTIEGLKAASLPSEQAAKIIPASDAKNILIQLNQKRDELIAAIKQRYEDAKTQRA